MRRRTLILFALASWVAACVAFVRAAPPVYRAWTQADLVDAAARFSGRIPPERRQYAVFVALNGVAPERRAKRIRALGYVANSLSREDQISLPQEVPGTEGALVWFDIGLLGMSRKALDKLGELGSGPAPFPEPYYHAVDAVAETEYEEYTETVKYTDAEGYTYQVYDYAAQKYVWKMTTVTKRRPKASARKKTVVALSPALNKATAVGLAATLGTNFPIFEYRWFVANALTEPRYHELLGLDDSLASVKKLAAVDDRTADRVGAQVRGAVLVSDVAHHNRLLERTPTLQRYGRGTYQESYDFKTSVNLQNVLEDLLNEKPDAKEVIWTLPNGLQGFYVADANDKRLDKADGDVANNRRSRFRDTQVRTAFHCIACHLPDKGWIHIDDEVRELAKETITLAALAVEKNGKDRGRRVRQKYLGIDFNELLTADQAVVEAAVRASTGGKAGLTCAETAREVTDTIYEYLHAPVTLDQLALELGYPKAAVLRACETKGIGNVLVGLRVGRPQRRDQIEAVYSRIAAVLYATETK